MIIIVSLVLYNDYYEFLQIHRLLLMKEHHETMKKRRRTEVTKHRKNCSHQ